MEINILDKAQLSFTHAKWYMMVEGKLQTRATFLRLLASQGIVPRFTLGMKTAPSFILNNLDFSMKFLNHLLKQGEENLNFLTGLFVGMVSKFCDDAEGYLKSVEHYYKDNIDGFESCKDQNRPMDVDDVKYPKAETYQPDEEDFACPLVFIEGGD